MVNQRLAREGRMIPVRVEGQRRDVAYDAVAIGDGRSDKEIRRTWVGVEDVPAPRPVPYAIEGHTDGGFAVRPQAVFE